MEIFKNYFVPPLSLSNEDSVKCETQENYCDSSLCVNEEREDFDCFNCLFYEKNPIVHELFNEWKYSKK